MNSTDTTKRIPARAGLTVEEIERLAKLQRESRALRDRIAAEVAAEKRQPAKLPDAAMRGLLESAQNEIHGGKRGDAETQRGNARGEWSPLFRWFAVMCGFAAAGIVALSVLGSRTPDAVIIVTLAAGITGLSLGAIGYLLGGAK